jgi:hypothetical protein
VVLPIDRQVRGGAAPSDFVDLSLPVGVKQQGTVLLGCVRCLVFVESHVGVERLDAGFRLAWRLALLPGDNEKIQIADIQSTN